MTDEIQSAKKAWTSAQVYGMSIVCLLVGIALGYLYRGSSTHNSPAAVTQTQGASPEMAAQGGMPGMGGAQPTPEQLKTMAEKKIAPLFEDLKKNPKDTDTLTKIGTYYMAAGQFEDAEKYFKQVVDIKPSADAWTKLSNAQAYAGSGEKAIASLNSALLLDPKFANALFNLGLLKWQVQNDPKGAIACWETLIRTNPDHPKLDQVKELIAHAKEQMKAPKAKPVKQ